MSKALVRPPQLNRPADAPVKLRRVASAIAGSVAIALSLWGMPALADPFRSANPRNIDDTTEQAFDALFMQGNYKQASDLLQRANPNEPLGFAMKASLGYLNEDWDTLRDNARLTREAAERLTQSDPLRGHLYTAAGLFLEGAYTLSTEGTVAATPDLLSKLQQIFSELSQAERIDANDPELNLLKGYMDLMLAVNVPFAEPDQAIARLQSYAAPSYLVQRGIAIGYRDLGQFDQAIAAVDQALAETPNNPDLLYLKAQILVRQGKDRESLDYFTQAMAQQAQLPRNLYNQISWEHCRANNRVQGVADQPSRRQCRPLLRQ